MRNDKLSISKLRAAGFTAFEAELLNYTYTHGAQGSITGVPGHPRYGTSSQIFEVKENSESCIDLLWVSRDKHIILPTPGNYISGRKTDTNNINTNNNNNQKTNKKMTTTETTPGLEVFNQLLQQQQQIGYNAAKDEFAKQIESLQAQLATAKNNGTGTTIIVNVGDECKTTKTDKVLHEKFEWISNLIANGSNVYLYGPAGSGKNVICKEVANALGLDFYYQNTILTKFDVSGYKNAQGVFEQTEFYKAWVNGGLFMLDEIDNSTAEALVALNAALANGYYTFADLGKVQKHKDFRCIAAGNTNGQGATDEYCGRYKMDESSRDRFAFVRIDYSSKIEESICKGHKDVLDFVRGLRVAAKELQISLICGYRALSNLCKYYNNDTTTVLDAFVLRGMQIDDIKELSAKLDLPNNKYAEALTEMCK